MDYLKPPEVKFRQIVFLSLVKNQQHNYKAVLGSTIISIFDSAAKLLNSDCAEGFTGRPEFSSAQAGLIAKTSLSV